MSLSPLGSSEPLALLLNVGVPSALIGWFIDPRGNFKHHTRRELEELKRRPEKLEPH